MRTRRRGDGERDEERGEEEGEGRHLKHFPRHLHASQTGLSRAPSGAAPRRSNAWADVLPGGRLAIYALLFVYIYCIYFHLQILKTLLNKIPGGRDTPVESLSSPAHSFSSAEIIIGSNPRHHSSPPTHTRR